IAILGMTTSLSRCVAYFQTRVAGRVHGRPRVEELWIRAVPRGARYSGGQIAYAVKSTQRRSRVFGILVSSALPIVPGGSANVFHHFMSDLYPICMTNG